MRVKGMEGQMDAEPSQSGHDATSIAMHFDFDGTILSRLRRLTVGTFVREEEGDELED